MRRTRGVMAGEDAFDEDDSGLELEVGPDALVVAVETVLAGYWDTAGDAEAVASGGHAREVARRTTQVNLPSIGHHARRQIVLSANEKMQLAVKAKVSLSSVRAFLIGAPVRDRTASRILAAANRLRLSLPARPSR